MSVKNEWMRTSMIRPDVVVNELIVMPDHLHGILIIKGSDGFEGVSFSGVKEVKKADFTSPSKTIGAMIRGFKAATAKKINQLRQTPSQPVWQRNYFENIIRSEKDFNNIREYIRNNPMNWNKSMD